MRAARLALPGLMAVALAGCLDGRHRPEPRPERPVTAWVTINVPNMT